MVKTSSVFRNLQGGFYNIILLRFLSSQEIMGLFGSCSLISKKRFNKIYLPHTYLGKIFGGVVFVLPVAMQFVDGAIWMSLICTIASIHVIELFIIQSENNKALDFVPTIFSINKEPKG